MAIPMPIMQYLISSKKKILFIINVRHVDNIKIDLREIGWGSMD
jgi:hypothetical protein